MKSRVFKSGGHRDAGTHIFAHFSKSEIFFFFNRRLHFFLYFYCFSSSFLYLCKENLYRGNFVPANKITFWKVCPNISRITWNSVSSSFQKRQINPICHKNSIKIIYPAQNILFKNTQVWGAAYLLVFNRPGLAGAVLKSPK